MTATPKTTVKPETKPEPVEEAPKSETKAAELPKRTTLGAWAFFRRSDDGEPLVIQIDADEVDSRRAAMASSFHPVDVVFVPWGWTIQAALAVRDEAAK